MSSAAEEKSADAPPSTSGPASSAGPASRAACSLARTRPSRSSTTEALRTPTPSPTTLMTATERSRAEPLVVSVLPAQRRAVLLLSETMTTQPSARDSSSARSTREALIGRPPARC